MLRDNLRRRCLARAGLAALAVWLLIPALAEAQQPLFPNLTVHKRKRVPCDCEDPIYGVYRRQYYGYYPTCWRPFPPGWGCPSPEAPNSALAMEEIRREIKRQAEQQPEEPEAPAGEMERSPFEAQPGLPGQPGPTPRPGGEPPIPLPREERSPFELPGDNPPRPTPAPAPGTGLGGLPESRVAPGRDSAIDPPPIEFGPPAINGPATGSAATEVPIPPPRRTLLGGLVDGVRGFRRR